jgi:hypothetical protein
MSDSTVLIDVPAWLIELVGELLESFLVDYPLGWQAYFLDPPLEESDGPTYEIHVWPSLGVYADGELGWEDAVYPLEVLLGMFRDTKVHVTHTGVMARTREETKTRGYTLVWALHFTPPENVAPNHRILDDDGHWENLEPTSIVPGDGLN